MHKGLAAIALLVFVFIGIYVFLPKGRSPIEVCSKQVAHPVDVAEGIAHTLDNDDVSSNVAKSGLVVRETLVYIVSTNQADEETPWETAVLASSSEERNTMSPAVWFEGDKIDDKTKEVLAAQLLAAGFQKTSYGRYVASGLSIDDVKKVISFDEKVGALFERGGLARGEQSLTLRMPQLTASIKHSTLFPDRQTETFIAIHDEIVNPRR
jgi:hypothetical protein